MTDAKRDMECVKPELVWPARRQALHCTAIVSDSHQLGETRDGVSTILAATPTGSRCVLYIGTDLTALFSSVYVMEMDI